MKMRPENYLDNNNTLYKHQYGFWKTYSTNLAQIGAVDEKYSNLNDGLYSIGIYLYLQKVLNTNNHDILLEKLQNYGIRGTPRVQILFV